MAASQQLDAGLTHCIIRVCERQDGGKQGRRRCSCQVGWDNFNI